MKTTTSLIKRIESLEVISAALTIPPFDIEIRFVSRDGTIEIIPLDDCFKANLEGIMPAQVGEIGDIKGHGNTD